MALASCVSQQPGPEPQRESFNEADFAPYAKEGTAEIIGSAFLKTRSGEVKVGAGCTVELIPMTPYVAERYERVLRGLKNPERDYRMDRFKKTTVADAQGNFEFENLPAGTYGLQCKITWEIVDDGEIRRTGGVTIAKVVVADGKRVKVVLTQ